MKAGGRNQSNVSLMDWAGAGGRRNGKTASGIMLQGSGGGGGGGAEARRGRQRQHRVLTTVIIFAF